LTFPAFVFALRSFQCYMLPLAANSRVQQSLHPTPLPFDAACKGRLQQYCQYFFLLAPFASRRRERLE
jgi:hypothetical protein